jgi:MFS family permease
MVLYYTYKKIRAYRARKAADADSSSQTQLRETRPKKCSQCAREKSRARKYRWKLLLSLLPPFFIGSLDLTIVATALPTIASHFDKFNQLNWVVTSFTLTSTAFIPVFGQLADVFGRHAALQSAIIIMTIGSILCAAAPAWGVLLLGRALQGVGTAGVSNVAMIVLADTVSLKEQAVNTSIFQLLNGIGYAVGPVLGGYLTNANWRYCFVVAAALSAISVVTLLFLRKDLLPGKVSLSHPAQGQSRLGALAFGLSTLDIGGITLFVLGVGLIILGTAWGGSTYSWNSAAVLSSLIIGAVLFVVFLVYESLLCSKNSFLAHILPRDTVPMVPTSILKAKDVSLISIISASTGAAIYSVFYFIGIYFTLVEGYKASHAGTQLLYYVPGIGVGVYVAMFICNVAPRQTFVPLVFGTIIETAGISVLSYAVKARNETLVNVIMAIAGAGTGMRFMPSSLHLAGMYRQHLASVLSILRFAMPFGGTLALTIMGSVFQNKMSNYFGSDAVTLTVSTGNGTSSSGSLNLHNSTSLDVIGQLPTAEQNAIRSQGATATMWAFIAIIPILALSLLASLFLGNVWISPKKGAKRNSDKEKDTSSTAAITNDQGLCKRHAPPTVGSDPADTNNNAASDVEILTEVYLLAVINGDVSRLKRPGASPATVAPIPQSSEDFAGQGNHLKTRLEKEQGDQ